MVEKIYLKDAYVKDFEATVSSVDNQIVELDRTAFYPTGGGQPSDSGTISFGNSRYKVIEVSKSGDSVLHKMENAQGLEAGTQIEGHLDWEKRYMHMRLHTALHIIDGVVHKNLDGNITGGQIYDDRARMDFDVPGLDRQKVEKIIEAAQEIVDKRLTVSVKFMSKEEASAVPGIARTAPGEELMRKLDIIRIIDIEGFDFQLDGGTHVANTSEVGKIGIIKYENKGSHNKRIEIALL
ncbi:MAG: alanyl-tRNA editing protein [Candidatus Micrarchaeales archaeon]|jgi:misacylated tRNA(Ala) deacylase|uniref:Threonyl/alanyl tRNA synthetase SAD n=1 Tax=Candidatus Micrarchaeum acidiphilum ARMAN-2 TaxID=425595 RepID=C7DI51_MICA2|nr:MAG: Threonyl/alanyl tRNA synthetase SAD [Candidatus Micrarchaeum acidiphilum ARMAN-2]MCW6160874.1 alanyl-tRNA editing protein [Candidatus Micrarchaeales archaeon]